MVRRRLDFLKKIQESGVDIERVLEKRLFPEQEKFGDRVPVCGRSCGNHLGGLHTGEPRQDRGRFSGPEGHLG